MKKLLKLIATLLILVLLVLYVPYYVHPCSECGEWILGPGYKANKLVDLVSEDEVVVCRACAEKQHALSSVLGKDVEEFRRDAFVDPITRAEDFIAYFQK